MSDLLVATGLRKAFGGVIAVDDVSLSVGRGQLVALIGPNGAGKTTCFNIVGGQIRLDAGSVRLAGTELVGLAPHDIWRLGVGRTFQIAATFATLSVRENVQVALLSRERRLTSPWGAAGKFRRDEAQALLARVGIGDLAARPCALLSYADLKRVELALALANRPRLLLMDEPTAGMAPAERAALMTLVAGIVRDDGVGVLFTEHDIEVVFAHADRVLVMNRGRLIAAGPPALVRADTRVQDIYLGPGA